MKAEFLFLGTGGSSGIPMIGCSCPVCTSQDPCNKRLRPSALVKIGDKKLLIDAGPDFRTQALSYRMNHLDGVILTHSHFDHVAGIDELRTYYLLYRTPLAVLASKATLEDLKRRYEYLFREKRMGKSLSAQLEFHVLEAERGETTFIDVPLRYMTYEQGGMLVNGYRFGSLAYVSDIREYPETLFDDLSGLEILVLGALRQEPSLMHFTFEEGIAFAQKIGAKQTYFTHIGHETEHASISASLPQGFELAHDGLQLEFSYES